MRASIVVPRGLSSCGLWALERRFSSCGARAYLLHGMWDLPGAGLEPVSSALAGRFLIIASPGKFLYILFLWADREIDECGIPCQYTYTLILAL